MADMARSLGLMAIITAAVLLLTPARGLIFPGSVDKQPPVDYSSDVTGFGRVAGAPALAPTAVPTSWRANAASLGGGGGSETLHIGWVTPGARFAGLDETTAPAGSVVTANLGASSIDVVATTTIDGQVWQLRKSDRGEQAFTRQAGPVFVIVTGNATDAQLRMLCASLR
jgi:hypothetical protein